MRDTNIQGFSLLSFNPTAMDASSKKKDSLPKAAAPKEAATAPQEAKRGPVKQFREGDVSASVFARERNGTTFHSVSFTRSYKDRDGQWKYTKNFDVDDLGKLVTVAQRSAEYVDGIAHPENRNPED